MSEKNRFVSFKEGKAFFGIDPSARWIIDLYKKRQALLANPLTSIFEPEFGINWIEWSGEEIGDFLLDDDDGYLWLEPTTITENGDYDTHEESIDSGEAEVAINIKELTFYHKGNGCYSPILKA